MRSSLRPKESIENIGTLVRDTRKFQNLSQSVLAQKTNLNQKTISSLENGAEGTEIRTILLVFKELGLKLDIGVIGTEKPIYSSENESMKTAVKNHFVSPDRREILTSLKSASGRLKEAGVISLSLFGSIARNEAGPNSDIDIAYDVKGKPDLFTIGKIEDIIQDLFPYKVDLVRLKNLRGKMREAAERDMINVI